MLPKYYINQGCFTEDADSIVFDGKLVKQINPMTNGEFSVPMWGQILFPTQFRAGKMSCEISFDDVDIGTRAGFVFNYQSKDGVTQLYQVGIRNQGGAYCLDYFDGKKWDYKYFGGMDNSLKAKVKYSISVEISGNNLAFFINDVQVFSFGNLISRPSGICGLYIYNSYPATFSNIIITARKPSVFTIMKFEKNFDILYEDVIKVQCDKQGFNAVRADEFYTSNSILQDIIREISNASIIIADITMDNPNVFYELGYAHALQKPTILLADVDQRERLPFDISGYRTIFYSNTIGGKKDIEERLAKFIQNITETSIS